MLILDVVQTVFGFAALAACAVAIRDAFTRNRQLGMHLATAGLFAVVFFLSVPEVPIEIIGVAFLTIVCGGLMHPRAPRSHIDIGDDSTIRSRRL